MLIENIDDYQLAPNSPKNEPDIELEKKQSLLSDKKNNISSNNQGRYS